MGSVGRQVLAVGVGASLWAFLWLAGTALAQAALPGRVVPDRPLNDPAVLFSYLGYSVVLSVLAGFVSARLAPARPLRAVGVLAVLQLGLGIVSELSYWSLLPAWYHLAFLALIVPATLYGGTLGRARGSPRGAASV